MSPDDLEMPPTLEQEARDRRAANIFLLVAGIVLVGVGVWLADAMIDARRPTTACRRAAATAIRSKRRGA